MSLPLSTNASYQAALLGGLLTVTSACVPTQKDGETDPIDSSAASLCPVSKPPKLGEPEGVIQLLAERQVPPETFFKEDLDRFATLSKCSETEIKAYSNFQSGLSARVAKLSNDALEKRLAGLYDQAFVFDETTGEMSLGSNAKATTAKHQLDLWLAAIDHQAYVDESFLSRLWEAGPIRAIAMLASPEMSAADRGNVEKLRRAHSAGKDLVPVYRENARDSYQRLFSWINEYDGTELYLDTPFLKSATNAYMATRAYFGEESFAESLKASTLPKQAVEKALKEHGLLERVQQLRQLTTDQALDYLQELSLAFGVPLKPKTTQKLAREANLLSVIFHERSVDLREPLKKRLMARVSALGLPPADIELIFEVEQGAIKYTADRLDDYRNRFVFLRRYRGIYRDLMSSPLNTVFSLSHLARYSFWGNFVMNRSQSGIPVHLDDLDQIRTEVRASVSPQSAFKKKDFTFETRDRKAAFWARPEDLGLCDEKGPLQDVVALEYNGTKAGEFICNNVDWMAFLPPSLLPPHAAAAAFGVFGVATVNNEGYTPGSDWSRNVLAGALVHEASHIDWFRSNFDQRSNRLAMLGPNERRAYALSHAMMSSSYSEKDSLGPQLAAFFEQAEETVRLSNKRLGLSESDLDPESWNPQWNEQHILDLAFQPAELRQLKQLEELVTKKEGSFPDEAELRLSGLAMMERAIPLMLADRRDQSVARDTLVKIIKGEDVEELVLSSHPLSRVINGIRQSMGQQPVFIIDMDSEELKASLAELARYLHISVALTP